MTTLSHSLFLLRRHNAALRTGDHAKAADYRERLDHEDERNGFVRRPNTERVLKHGEKIHSESCGAGAKYRLAVHRRVRRIRAW